MNQLFRIAPNPGPDQHEVGWYPWRLTCERCVYSATARTLRAAGEAFNEHMRVVHQLAWDGSFAAHAIPERRPGAEEEGETDGE